jgi:hypothetical protein
MGEEGGKGQKTLARDFSWALEATNLFVHPADHQTSQDVSLYLHNYWLSLDKLIAKGF